MALPSAHYGRVLTSRVRASSATAARLPDPDQTALPRLVKRAISRFPPKKLPHMPGSSTTPGCPDARADASVHVAFRLRNSVGAQDMNLCEAQLLPMRSPTDASLPPLRASAHGSGSMRIATPSSCRTSTDYSLPVSPAHCERILHATPRGTA